VYKIKENRIKVVGKCWTTLHIKETFKTDVYNAFLFDHVSQFAVFNHLPNDCRSYILCLDVRQYFKNDHDKNTKMKQVCALYRWSMYAVGEL